MCRGFHAHGVYRIVNPVLKEMYMEASKKSPSMEEVWHPIKEGFAVIVFPKMMTIGAPCS